MVLGPIAAVNTLAPYRSKELDPVLLWYRVCECGYSLNTYLKEQPAIPKLKCPKCGAITHLEQR